jgi:hypothetical protein
VVLVRPGFVMLALQQAMPSRPELSVYGLQIVQKGKVIAKKAAWFRNVPYRVWDPTLGQLEIRYIFGGLAREAAATGQVGTRDNPRMSTRLGEAFYGAAAYIADNMYGRTAPHRLPPEQWPSRLRRTLRTLAGVEAELRARGVEPGAIFVIPPGRR